MHTNIFVQDLGNREQKFYLWCDPNLDFHNYSVLLTPNKITETELGKVDRNYHYQKSQAMRIYSSLWNADDCVTKGGLFKTDWSKTPFVASLSNFSAATSSSNLAGGEALDSNQEQKLQWV